MGCIAEGAHSSRQRAERKAREKTGAHLGFFQAGLAGVVKQNVAEDHQRQT